MVRLKKIRRHPGARARGAYFIILNQDLLKIPEQQIL
jgi:hypothetical protein